MTPFAIITGRSFQTKSANVSVATATNTSIAPGDAKRVALVVALSEADAKVATMAVAIGPLANGVVVPLTCITPGHPVCYLSVDKIGNAFFSELFAVQTSGAAALLGVTQVQQTQELPDK